jgi:hypothetical protein
VLAQTFADCEIIVVDDGSTDDTREVVKQLGKRVRYIYRQSHNPNVSRNTGIHAARGRFIAFLDADDKWLPGKLARQVPLMESNPRVGLVYARAIMFDSETGAVVGRSNPKTCHRGRVLRDIYRGQFVPSPTPLIRRDVFEQIGLFDEARFGTDDWEMWLRIAAQYEFDYAPEYLAMYRLHASHAGKKSFQSYETEVMEFAAQSAEQYPELRPLRAWRLSTLAEQLAWRLIQEGDPMGARLRLRRAIAYCPARLSPYFLLGLLCVFGRSISSADWPVALAAYVQGKYLLANLRLAEARTQFGRSIGASLGVWWRPYAGWALTLGGRVVARWARRRFGLEIYVGGAEPSLRRLTRQQW